MNRSWLDRHSSLVRELGWLISLRWLAGIAVMGLAVTVGRWTAVAWADRWGWMLGVGVGIVGYNAVFWGVCKAWPAWSARVGPALFLAAGGVLADLGCLTLLVVWTGGVHSPLLGLFVLHIVFVSLLLPKRTSFIAVGVSMVLVIVGLWLGGHWPGEQHDTLVLTGWVATLLLVAFVTDHITLSLRAQETTLIRHEQALVQQEKMTAMGQLVAGVAHEISNPLASMDSLLQLVSRHPERLDLKTLGTLGQQVDRISRILRQMTDFAHPNESGIELVSLNEVVEQALSLVHFDQRIRSVELIRDLAPEDGTVHVSALGLQQVLVNLIQNALDALEQTEHPRLTIGTERRRGEAVIRIEDNGHGIEARHLGRIFEPFFTTKPLGRGTGLGLSISYRLISQYGGAIEVESRSGRGTIFTVTLPGAASTSDDREHDG